MHKFLSIDYTDCFLNELWDLSVAGTTFFSDISLLNDSAAQYLSCDPESVGAAALNDNRVDTATVAYYTGTTAGSRVCFVCDKDNGYSTSMNEQHPTTSERVCQTNGTWSGSPIICGTFNETCDVLILS